MPCSNPDRRGAALGRRDHVDEGPHRVVTGPPPHRHVDQQVTLDVLRGHVALVVVEERDGLGELLLPLEAQHLGHRLVGGEELAELGDAAVVAEALLDAWARRSRITSFRPGTMNDVGAPG